MYPQNNLQEPARPVTPIQNLPAPCAYKPLKLNYRVIVDKSIPYQSQATYPVSIQVPEVLPTESLEIVKPDPYRGKSYVYNTQTSSSPAYVPISTSYNFDLHVPSSPTP